MSTDIDTIKAALAVSINNTRNASERADKLEQELEEVREEIARLLEALKGILLSYHRP